MGDGPPKTPHKTMHPPPPVRRSISSYFLPRPAPPTTSPLTSPPDASPMESIHWAAINGARVITPRRLTHDIIASADLAVAIPLEHIPTLKARLSKISPLSPPTMADMLCIMNGLEIQLAMRRDMEHYSSTPMNGYCTTCVLDAAHRGTVPVPFTTPGLSRNIVSSLTVIRDRAQAQGQLTIVGAMERYINAMSSPSSSTTLAYSEWMDESLTMAAGRLTDSPSFQTWSEHSEGIFPAGWMQLNALIPDSVYQQPTAGVTTTLPSLFSAATPHCGYAKNHHFLIRFNNADLLQQLQWLTANIAAACALTTVSNTVATSPSLPRSTTHSCPLSDADSATESITPLSPPVLLHSLADPPAPHYLPNDVLTVTHGNLILRVTTKQFKRLLTHVALVDSEDMYCSVRNILDSTQHGRFLSCAVHPTATASDATPADGFCAYHTLWALDHQASSLSKQKDRRHLRTVMAPLCLDITPQGDLVAGALARLTRRSTLPRSLWPPLPRVAQWANTASPTFIWATSTNLPLPWLDLSGIPAPDATCILANTWTLPELMCLKNSTRHIALDSNHYFPLSVDTTTWEVAIDTFCVQLTEKLIEHRRQHRAHLVLPQPTLTPTTPPPVPLPLSSECSSPSPPVQSVPHPTVCTPSALEMPQNGTDSTYGTRKRVHFPPTLDDKSTARHPPPLIHPAMSCYHPPLPPALPSVSHRFLPRTASCRTPPSSRGAFPAGAELYILTSQVDQKDDRIVIGPSPFPGSTWAAYARIPSQYGDIIGRYTHYRGNRPPCTHPSDPPSSTGEYAMERPFRNRTIHQDPWLVDTCHARFVEEAPTFEQVNVDWITRNGHIYLINVSLTGDIDTGDLYLTNYGEEYWYNEHTPLSLLQLMYTKYSPVMSKLRQQAWIHLLQLVRNRTTAARTNWRLSALKPHLPPSPLAQSPTPAVTRTTAHHTPRGATTRADRPSTSIVTPLHKLQSHTRQRNRHRRQQEHKRAVIAGTTIARRITPPCAPYDPMATLVPGTGFTSITWAPPSPCPPNIEHTITELLTTHSPDVLWVSLPKEVAGKLHYSSTLYDTVAFQIPLSTATNCTWPVAIVLKTWIDKCKISLSQSVGPHLHLAAASTAFDCIPASTSLPLTTQIHPLLGMSAESSPSAEAPPLWTSDWIFTTQPMTCTLSPKSSLAIMHWPCRGALYCPGQYISNEVRHTINFIVRLMHERAIDIMWLSDAHILLGMLDPYIPDIHRALPDCRVLQFPTTRIQTTSYNKSNECMGGALAIVTSAWKGFITASHTDPLGLGILNAIDFNIHGLKFSSACYYFPPYTPGTGAATIHSRVAKYQQSTTAPTWAKRMTPHEFIRALAQKQQARATEAGHTRFVCGDFNADTIGNTAATSTLRSWCTTCTLHDPATTTKHRLPGHLTRQANSDKQADSTLDHHFHSSLNGSDISLRQLGTMNHPDTWRRSDHLPTWMTITIQRFVPTVPIRQSTPTAIRCDIDLQNKKELAQYQTLLTQALHTLPKKLRRDATETRARTTPRHSGRLISALLRLSVQVVEDRNGLGKSAKRHLHHTSQTPRSMVKDGYSPIQQLLHCYAVFYRCIIRKVFSTTRNAHTRYIWNSLSAYSLLTGWSKSWQDKYHDILSTTQLPPQARDLPHPRSLCSMPFSSITLPYLRTLLQHTHRHLHGADRLRMRNICNAAIRKREALRLKGKHAKLIELLTNGGTRSDLDLSTIPCPINGQIVDSYDVHKHINAHFADWYAIPSTLDPAGRLMATNLEWTRTLLHYLDSGHPQPLHPQSKIPLNLQDGIRRACAIKVTPEVQRQLAIATSQPLTFVEFDLAINDIRAGSAPGPSEATANMIKGWPTSVRRLAYAHMNNMWLAKFTPLWMKDKVVKLAPKVQGSSDLSNMRPISLYEVIRKVWTTTIARRIHLVWHNHDVLNATQYGYRLDQGTHMALINVLNTIESAHHDRTPTAITFWDVRRAFDSIPRTLQQLAWERLGVSRDIAQWFVQMDDGGLSFIATPLYSELKDINSSTALLHKDGHMSRNPHLAIIPARGVGQGESASSLLWTAVYDMLLDWIDPQHMSLHHYEKLYLQIPFTSQEAAQAQATAYADDLATISRGPKAMIIQQTISHWLSAFGAFSGLTLHPQKIVPVTINSPPLHKTQSLIVRDHQWKPISVPVLHQLATYKYLGVQLNLQGNYTSSLHLTIRDARARLQHLLVQPASPQAKMLYITAKIVPIVLYTACCMDWPLAAYAKLDATFIHAYRRILSLPERTPTAMYHLPPHLCGIGLPCLTDQAQVRKWHVFQRCSALGGAPATSVSDILSRIPGGLSPFDDWTEAALPPAHTDWPNRPTFMARSLVEWLAQNDLCCARRTQYLPTQREGQLLSSLAKDLQLWYDEEYYHKDDYEHYPVVAVTTDGAYKVSASTHTDILAPYTDLQDRASGGGGIILTVNSRTTTQSHIGIHICMDAQERGMTAYTWELLTQLVALHIIKEYPHSLPIRSDCMSAIARTNHALASHNNTLSTTTAGLIPTCMHQFAHRVHPRTVTHIPAHPENDEHRRSDPNDDDMAIYLADAIADGHNNLTQVTLGPRTISFSPRTLTIRHIFNELISPGTWHIRHLTHTRSPVLGDLMTYQHSTRLSNYTSRRDATSNGTFWSDTSYALAHVLHPPVANTPWQLARRNVLIFDKIGHGANRAKLQSLTPSQALATAACTYCGDPDSQEHCMIACPHAAFAPIRKAARQEQDRAAQEALRERGDSPLLTSYTRAISYYSWSTSSPYIRRLWLGTWSRQLYQALITPLPIDSPCTMAERNTMISIAASMTAPLLKAYRQIIALITTTPSGSRTHLPPPSILEPLPLLDHLPADNHKGGKTPHHMATVYQVHDNFLHVQPITTSTALLPLTPDEDIDHTNPVMQIDDDPANYDVSLYLHNRLFPDDGRLYDDS